MGGSYVASLNHATSDVITITSSRVIVVVSFPLTRDFFFLLPSADLIAVASVNDIVYFPQMVLDLLARSLDTSQQQSLISDFLFTVRICQINRAKWRT